jgi:hypothetical protein
MAAQEQMVATQNHRDLHRVTSEERLFSSEYNVTPGHGGAKEQVRWALRGYLPPKHLRIPGYDYGIPEDSEHGASPQTIVAKESIAELMAGCFLPHGAESMADDTQGMRPTLSGLSRQRMPGSLALVLVPASAKRGSRYPHASNLRRAFPLPRHPSSKNNFTPSSLS